MKVLYFCKSSKIFKIIEILKNYIPKAFIRANLNFTKNTQKQPKMTKKHQNDQNDEKHEKQPKMTKKHQKSPKMAKITKNAKVSNLGGPLGGPPGPEKKSVTK